MVEGVIYSNNNEEGICYVRDQNKSSYPTTKIKSDQTVDVIFRDGERKMTPDEIQKKLDKESLNSPIIKPPSLS